MPQEHMTNGPAKDHFYRRVGEAIEHQRLEQGLSIEKLAEIAHLTKATVAHAEQGQSCSLLVWAKLAFALDVNVNDLLPLDALR